MPDSICHHCSCRKIVILVLERIIDKKYEIVGQNCFSLNLACGGVAISIHYRLLIAM